jgi:hypothetical protein
MCAEQAYAKLSNSDLRPYLADMEQLAYARPSVLSEGNGRGSRIIDMVNGSGLAFTVAPERGMDIVEATFKGIPVAFRAPAGHTHPGRFESEGFGWLRSWSGGLVTTCGLRHVGPPQEVPGDVTNPNRGLHGSISAQSAENTGIDQEWKGSRYEIAVTGTMRQAAMFGENLRLKRRISTAMGDNTIAIDDTVTNLGSKAEIFQILYHCNFGFPAIRPGARLQAVEHPVKPRDAAAEPGLPTWNILDVVTPGAGEQCFLHQIPADDDGFARMVLDNPETGLRMMLAYDTSTLPNLMQWKMFDSGCYALGLEPTNSTVSGSMTDSQNGCAHRLEPGHSIRLRLRLLFQ